MPLKKIYICIPYFVEYVANCMATRVCNGHFRVRFKTSKAVKKYVRSTRNSLAATGLMIGRLVSRPKIRYDGVMSDTRTNKQSTFLLSRFFCPFFHIKKKKMYCNNIIFSMNHA